MPDLYYSKLLNYIKIHAECNPDKLAVIDGERQVSYKLLFENIQKTARVLLSMGLNKGDSIILCARKEIDFIYLYFGAHLVGITNVIIDAAAKIERVNYIADITKPKYIFGYDLDGYECRSITNIVEKFDNISSTLVDITEVNSHDIADIMFTTGTTGNPKGVCLSHANIAASASQINSFIKNDESDIEVLALPLSHSFALGRVRCTLLAGGTLVLLGSFANIKLLFDCFEKYHCSGFAITPAAWTYIKKMSGTKISRFSEQIKYIEIGSMPTTLEDKKLLFDIFRHTRICMYYGLTEASRSFFYELHDGKNYFDSIGTPVTDDVFAKIMSENGTEVSDGEQGEICIKGPHVMERYFKHEENENAFFGDFFRSGDLGYKKDGVYYLCGRKKEMINVGGNKVSPVTIEEAIMKLGVADCACTAIPDPDGMLGEVPKAFMVKGECKLEINDIKNQLKDLLESFQIPREYEWIEKIPRTESGKVQRLLLKGK